MDSTLQPTESNPVCRLAELRERLKSLPFRNRDKRQELHESWAGLLAQGRFDCFATLTFRRPVSTEAAGAAWADWTRWIRRKQGYRAEWFRVSERSSAGAIHFHALLGRCSGLRRLSALDYWRHRYGFGQVKRYLPGLGVRFYLSKYVCKDAEGELDCSFSRSFGRLLGRGPLSASGKSAAA